MRMFSIMTPTATLHEKAYSQELSAMDLPQLNRELFNYFDYVEETDSGREFHPIQISCCRVAAMRPLNMLYFMAYKTCLTIGQKDL